MAGNTKLVLLANGGDALTLAANGAFSFAAPIAFNTAYAVTVGTHPLWQNCRVSNGSGTATADVNSVQVNCDGAQALVTTLAGSATSGSNNATGAAASFAALTAVTMDISGNLYVADYGNNLIRKISPNGDVSTLAGAGPTMPGSTDGSGINARFSGPWSVDVDASGNLYVIDGNNLLIRKVTPDGTVTTLAGSMTSGWVDGQGTAASFIQPNGLRVDANGNIYVADGNMIRKITPEGVVSTLAGSTTAGFADGTGSAARFNKAWGLGIDASGHLHVVDRGNNKIRKVTPGGVVTSLESSQTPGSADDIGAAAQFSDLYDVTADLDGNLYAVSSTVIRKITPVR
ncbi:hypothetical protein [Variovorax sp. DT-64]|uniref:NHL domain-containing protein n=1 Tax=Variovorax sp. DT-64 TaxID=3396160 RepID=UPI003F1C73C1